MPSGFALRPQYSGRVDCTNCSGYRATFENSDNHGVPLTVWAVEYTVTIFDSDNSAALEYSSLSGSPSISGWAGRFISADQPIPGAAEDDLFMSIDPDTVPLQLGAISFARFHNLVAVTVVIGTEGADPQTSLDRFDTSVLYFIDLLVQNINR